MLRLAYKNPPYYYALKSKMPKKIKQLLLDVTSSAPQTFETFCQSSNLQLIHTLKALGQNSAQQFIYIWGEAASGKTHLLKASCQRLSLLGLTTFYLPGKNSQRLNPSILDNLDNMDLLCIDDLDAVLQNRDWEEALFHCYNKLIAQNGNLIITANTPPKTLDFNLPDLKSRMSNSIIFKLAALQDQDKIEALELRAKQLGIDLPLATSNFLLRHSQRDLATLFDNVAKLAKATLHSKGKITIPLAKKILNI